MNNKVNRIHIFEIKDFSATENSAKHIVESQLNVLLKAKNDIKIKKMNVFVNDSNEDFYKNLPIDTNDDIEVNFIPTLNNKKKKTSEKQSFASFHNFVVNNISKEVSAIQTSSGNSEEEIIVHVMDGTLDLTDAPSEFKKQETRIGEMIVDVLDMMDLLEHPVWFNTASDKGNIKFGHYFTNIDFINIDESCKLDVMPECIMFSGNSNLDWIIINANEWKKRKLPSLTMNNEYDYDFLSIKQLIAKFANNEHGYFESMFPTVPTEVGAYFRNQEFDRDLQKYDMKKYKENLERYRKNVSEYKNVKSTNIQMVSVFMKDILSGKLTDSDKKRLEEYSSNLVGN